MGICMVWSVVCFIVMGPILPASTSDVVTFQGASDVSAAVSIDRDQIAVADDEDNVLRIYTVSGGGIKATFDMTAFLQLDPNFPEADIEAAARMGDRIYWISSHGRNKDGKLRPNRYRFFATEIQKTDTGVSLKPVGRPYTTLLTPLLATKSLQGLGLQEAAGIDPVAFGTKKKGGKKLAPKDEGLNIEGLCASVDGKGLFIGFRNPIPKGRALVVPWRIRRLWSRRASLHPSVNHCYGTWEDGVSGTWSTWRAFRCTSSSPVPLTRRNGLPCIGGRARPTSTLSRSGLTWEGNIPILHLKPLSDLGLRRGSWS